MSAEDSPPARLPTDLGEFHVIGELGRGGSGIVYDATWGPRRVALKILHGHLVATERERSQFLAEARRLQAMTHPSIVKVLGSGELPDGRPYLAMERLEGETLATVLAREPLAMTEALTLFAELCGAVEALHGQGLVHRDLKPENVFVCGLPSGTARTAVLLDFGIAKELAAAASTMTQDGAVRGTPAYMAPERFFGQPASIASDVYELAVTFYVMLAARLPWDDLADPEARLSPRSLGKIEGLEVPALDVEIRRAMSTRAQNRPGSAAVLLEAVTAAARGDDVGPAETARMRPGKTTTQATQSAQPTTDRQTPLAWAPAPAPAGSRRRWPWIAALGLGGAIAAGAVWWQRDREPARIVTVTPVPAKLPDRPPAVVANDPWNGSPADALAAPAPHESKLPIREPEVDAATARKEIAAALGHLPADSQLVASGIVGELRRNPAFTPLFAKLGSYPQLTVLLSALPGCVGDIASGAEWFVAGVSRFDDPTGVVVLRGRWKRVDVEACFDDVATEQVGDARLFKLDSRGTVWLDFLDDHTAYLSFARLPATKVHALVTRAVTLRPRITAQLAPLPVDRTLAFAADGSGIVWPEGSLPAGADIAGWLRSDPRGATLDVVTDTHDAKIAAFLQARLDPQITDLFGGREGLGKLAVVRTATTVRVSGHVTSMLLGLVVSSVP